MSGNMHAQLPGRGDLALTEDDFKSRVIDLARYRHWMIYHPLPAKVGEDRWVTATEGDTGFPDIVFARRGVVLFRELKTQTGRTSSNQDRWGRELGTAFAVWRPSDWPRIQEELK